VGKQGFAVIVGHPAAIFSMIACRFGTWIIAAIVLLFNW
jgi:hypothetical protein